MASRLVTNLRNACLTALMIAMGGPAGWAAEIRAAQIVIAPQSLATALQAFSEQSGLQVGFESELAKGLQTQGTRGAKSPAEALGALLSGTGLEYQFVNDQTVVIREKASRQTASASEAGVMRLAQTEAAASDSPSQATTPAGQNEKADSSPKLGEAKNVEEIVVTAQKRGEENITDVPISVAVLGGDDLEKSGVRGVADVLNQVGGVYLEEILPGRSTITIRGASAGAQTLTGSSPVGYYLDEVPFSFIRDAVLPDANAFDLERVEVLRGPQGTLYGANSLNGVVRIITKDANLDAFEFKGRMRYGSTKDSEDSVNGDFAVNVPVIRGKLGVRAVASYADLGGFVSTATTPDFNDSDVRNYRLKVNAAPTENLDIELGVSISRIDTSGRSEANDDYIHSFPDDQAYERDYETYNLIVAYDLPFGTLQSSTGYINLTGVGALDFSLFGTPVNLVDNLSTELFTEEVRFSSAFGGPWQVSGGVFYRTAESVLDQAVDAFFDYPLGFTDESNSYAVFGEATRSFLGGKVELTGGIRYFEDRVTGEEFSTLVNGTAGPFVDDSEFNFDAITWRAVASYHPTDDLTFYTSMATGFRSGFGQAPTSLQVEPTLPPADEDELATFEIGAKGALLDGRVIYDTAAYYTEWEGSQQLTITSLGTAAIFNADSISGVGIDANIHAALTDRFSLNGSVGWNNLEFDSDVFRGNSAILLFPKGSRPSALPEITASLGAEYRFPVGGGLHGFVAANAYYNSERESTSVVGTDVIVNTSNVIFNGQLRAGVESDRWTAAVFADNVTNESGAVQPSDLTLGQSNALRLRPRTIGVQFSFNY